MKASQAAAAGTRTPSEIALRADSDLSRVSKPRKPNPDSAPATGWQSDDEDKSTGRRDTSAAEEDDDYHMAELGPAAAAGSGAVHEASHHPAHSSWTAVNTLDAAGMSGRLGTKGFLNRGASETPSASDIWDMAASIPTDDRLFPEAELLRRKPFTSQPTMEETWMQTVDWAMEGFGEASVRNSPQALAQPSNTAPTDCRSASLIGSAGTMLSGLPTPLAAWTVPPHSTAAIQPSVKNVIQTSYEPLPELSGLQSCQTLRINRHNSGEQLTSAPNFVESTLGARLQMTMIAPLPQNQSASEAEKGNANNISALKKQVAEEKENYNEAMMCMQDAGNLLALGPSSQLYAHITAMNQPSSLSLANGNNGVPGNVIKIDLDDMAE
ncbi:hypothetical protein BJX66DRAFT_344286 [Aspergillus keveii]|uniref:Uncharacterized protein n=1 Tax=Aspergillus keveii TaxID=714993 RepID=A0ABR4FLP9_9EURO